MENVLAPLFCLNFDLFDFCDCSEQWRMCWRQHTVHYSLFIVHCSGVRPICKSVNPSIETSRLFHIQPAAGPFQAAVHFVDSAFNGLLRFNVIIMSPELIAGENAELVCYNIV